LGFRQDADKGGGKMPESSHGNVGVLQS
jgi:hypothetical protein